MALRDRFQSAWNAFFNKDPTLDVIDLGVQSYIRPDRPRFTRGNERTIITSLFNRIALDVATIDIKHVRVDENGKFLDYIDSGLNDCFNLEANIDQTSRAFVQDIVMSMLDEGCVAVVPVDTIGNPFLTTGYDIKTMRTAKILAWYPKHVKLRLYNDRTGEKEDITLPKSDVAIIENPLYSVVNEPNSVLQRLIRKLSLLDSVDEQTSAGKLDMIIQLPYVIKSEAREKQANERRKSIENQLNGSKYGIAYIDGTEKVTQLNRPLENNLMSQIEYLTDMLYSQLGMTKDILNGTANGEAMTNYYTRTIEPIVAAIVDEVRRKFLSKTARTQRQSVMYFRNPFKLVPVTEIASIADSFTRNEIMTSNEIRQIVGLKPSSDPNADELRNKNLNQPAMGEEVMVDEETGETINEEAGTGQDLSNMPISELM